ncbi:(R)-mandelonitrile lyase [Taklimakanibacter deserti]|uniref:(R)-mandelonitrile lyase n=1 Tax=Taklimakanibacter deserti TaxID=2267839 RepID=UPI000E65097F
MEIKRSGSQPSAGGPTEYFTGAVRIDMRFHPPSLKLRRAPVSSPAKHWKVRSRKASEPGRVGGAFVTFEPGARTAWHTHPLGQTLIVASGSGWVQSEGGPKQEIRPGDIVWIPAGEKHWHGATATTAMTHIAIAEALDGKSVDWLEKVNDGQYGA